LPPEARFDQRTGIRNWSDSYYDVGPDQYCFVASREFGAPRVEQTLLPPERNVTIINQTTNVTNITYNNTTIVNEGPSYDQLRSISREPVQRYRLERNVNVDIAGGPPRSEMRGETVVVAAPVIAAPVANERPPTVKQTIATAAIDLGWAAIANQEEARKARQKMKSEATAPPNAPPKKFVKAESTTTATTQPAETSSTTSSASIAPTAAATTAPVSTTPPTPAQTMAPRHTATVAPTATVSTTAAATRPPISTTPATPAQTIAPRHTATGAPTSAPAMTSTPMTSPTPSQRRGRLLVPNASPTPRIAPSPTPTVASSPALSETSPPTRMTPASTPASSVPPAISAQTGMREKSKVERQRFPQRNVGPSPATSAAASAEPTAPISTPSPNAASTMSTTPPEKLTKQEKKEQKREERRELKRERREGGAVPSPSPTP
jgi:hypothetical protein